MEIRKRRQRLKRFQMSKFDRDKVCPDVVQFPPVDGDGITYDYCPKPGAPIPAEEFRDRFYRNYEKYGTTSRLNTAVRSRMRRALGLITSLADTEIRLSFKTGFSLALLETLPIAAQPAASSTGMGADDFSAVQRIPKRNMRVVLEDAKRDEFYGLYAREGVCFVHFALWFALCNVPTAIFGFVWMFRLGHPGDIPGGFHMLAISTSLTATFFGSTFLHQLLPND
jgi:hypothetical protein